MPQIPAQPAPLYPSYYRKAVVVVTQRLVALARDLEALISFKMNNKRKTKGKPTEKGQERERRRKIGRRRNTALDVISVRIELSRGGDF